MTFYYAFKQHGTIVKTTREKLVTKYVALDLDNAEKSIQNTKDANFCSFQVGSMTYYVYTDPIKFEDLK